jgi:hypothetical protein
MIALRRRLKPIVASLRRSARAEEIRVSGKRQPLLAKGPA